MAKKKNYKPTGFSIERKDLTFTLNWTPNKKYKAQVLNIYMDNDLKNPVHTYKDPDINKGTKTKAHTVPQSSYMPTTDKSFSKITMEVQGKVGKKWHSDSKSYTVKAPLVPKYIKPENYDNQAYTYRYSWDRNEKDTEDDTRMFKEYQWDTVLVSSDAKTGKALDENDWVKCKTQKITMIDINTGQTLTNQLSTGHTTDGSIIIVDNPSVVTNGLRRFVRVRALSAAGASTDYQYSDHAFGAPSGSSIGSAEVKISDDQKTSGTVSISASTTNIQPIDSVTLQYAITKPKTIASTSGNVRKTDITVPDGVSWTTYRTFNATGSAMSLDFTIDTPMGEDECLFIRTSTTHDNETINSAPQLVPPPQGYGALSSPTFTSCTANPVTRRVSIGVTNPTNLDNNKSFVAVFFRTDNKTEPDKPIGVIPYGTSSATFVYPEVAEGTNISFGVQTFVANYSPATYPGTLTYFEIPSAEIKMKSDSIVWDNSSVPLPPSNVKADRFKEGVIQVTWDWTWTEANSAEISWSDDPDAWESTNEPSTYTVNNLYSGKWNISGLSAGNWYVRVRLISTTEEATIYGTYSETKKVNLSSAPNTPALTLEPNVVAVDGQSTAYWEFSSTDGTDQSYAELAEATKVNNEWTYTPMANAKTNTGKTISFSPADYGWVDGTKHYVSVRVTSSSGMDADWSKPVELGVASKPVLSVTGLGWVPGETLENNVLTTLPLSFSVAGAGTGGYATAVITRRQGFNIPRPDDSTEHGYDGEVIASRVIQKKDPASFSFAIDDTDVVGHFDDDALYRLVVTITDSFGQTVRSEPYNFSVKWADQAKMPTATVELDYEDEVAFITPIQPAQAGAGSYCDIYRLSMDRPQLIYHKAEFGTKYVDPYPTYGRSSGYRVVYLTKNGDHRLDTGESSWVDYSNDEEEVENRIGYLDKFAITIDFDGDSIDLPYDISLSNTWNKDFTTTKYLGGSIEGDWTPGVQRTGSYKLRIPVEQDKELVYKSRLLADFAGVCHVRTPEGSNFYANVDVQEDREAKFVNRISSVTLNITKVDAIKADGIPYDIWISEDQE